MHSATEFETDTMFTPGPWELHELRTDSGRAYRMGSGEMLVAGKGCCIIYDDYGWGFNERKANACLIAAAPDLYLFLEETVTLLESPDLANDAHKKAICENARAVLSKARGEAA